MTSLQQSTFFDVLVIGGGHAGVEAAYAAARLGMRVGLVSIDFKKIAYTFGVR